MLIVQKTVESSTMMDTVLVGDDIYLLVLLCYHANLDSHNIIIIISTRAKEKHQKSQSVEHQGCEGTTRP